MRLQQEPVKELTKIIEFLNQVLENQEKALGENAPYFFKDFLSSFIQTTCQLVKLKLTKAEFSDLLKQLPPLLAGLLTQNVENIEMFESVKHFFDSKSRLFQYHFLADENEILINNSLEAMDPQNKQWRESLQPGSLIDAIKVDPEQKAARCWNHAKVVENLPENRLSIAFEHDGRLVQRQISMYSNEIAERGTKATEEWREEIKVGDKCDCFDSTGYWYASTIVAMEQKQYQGDELRMIQIAFRINHPDGDKKDDQGNTYYGWDKEYDEWMPLYSARVAKYQQYTQDCFENQTTSAQNANTKNAAQDTLVDDSMDLMVSSIGSKKIYAVQRKQCRSNLLIDFINSLGENGCFDKILERVNQNSESPQELSLLYVYINCLGKAAMNYHRSFAEEFFPKLEQGAKNKILNSIEAQLRALKKEWLDEILQSLYKLILPRVSTRDQLKCDQGIFTIDIGHLFLRQNFLERRIDGLKLINEQCKNCLSILTSKPSPTQNPQVFEKKLEMVDQLSKKLQSLPNILTEIFHKNRTHSQLVSRSEKLLRLLMAKDLFKESDLETVWQASELNDGDLQNEVYKILTGAASEMQLGHKKFFLRQMEGTQLVERHVGLISEICMVKTSENEQEVIDQGLQILWNILHSSKVEGLIMINRATLGFANIVAKQDLTKKLVYLDKLATNLKEKRPMGYLTIKIMAKIFKVPEEDELKQLIAHMETKHQLKSIVFQEFESYIQRVVEQIRVQGLKGREIHNIAVVDLFMHEDQVTERLEFIKLYSKCKSLESGDLKFLWTALITEAVDENDSKLMYVWLKEICDQHLKKEQNIVVSIEEIIKFYKETMEKEPDDLLDEYKWLSIQGYQCIQSFVVLINSVQNKLIKVTQDYGVYINQDIGPQSSIEKKATQKFTSFNNVTGAKYTSYTFSTDNKQDSSVGPENKKKEEDDPDSIEIICLVPPKDLYGYNILWRIATESTSKMVIDSAAKLLVQMHHEIIDDLKPQLPELEDEFIKYCFDIVEAQLPVIGRRTPEEKEKIEDAVKCLPIYASTIQKLRVFPIQERRIIRSLFLLRQLIRASEKNGTYSLKPHSSLRQGVLLPYLQIQNNITGDKEGFSKRIEIAIDSNATVWDLKVEIGKQVVKCSQEDSKEQPPIHPATIRLFQMTTSQDLNDPRNGNTLAELKFKPNENLGAFKKRVDLTRKAPIVEDNQSLTKKAERVAREIFDRFVDKEDGTWSEEACQRFQTEWVGIGVKGTMVDAQVKQIKDVLASNETIGFEEFRKFIIVQCVGCQDDQLRYGLRNLGYAQDLTKLPINGDPDNVMQLRQQLEHMPRQKVSNNQSQFDTLILLLNLHKEVEQRAIEMIQMLPTNPQLYDAVISNKGLNFENEHKTLYSLEIIEAVLIKDQENMSTKIWLEKFVESQGFEELQNKLIEALNSLQNNSKSIKYVDQLFKIITLLLKASQGNHAPKIEEKYDPKPQEDSKYVTPKKQIKKTTTTDTVGFEITQDFLFGGEPEAPEEPKEEKVEAPAKTVLDSDHLQKALKDSGLANEILKRANIPQLQDQIIQVVSTLMREDELKVEHRAIIESAMSLWAIMLSNTGSQVEIQIDSEFLEMGLLKCQDFKVRECFQNTFKSIGETQQQLTGQLMESLLTLFGKVTEYEKTTQFFSLIESILAQRLKKDFEVKTLVTIIDALKNHKSKETNLQDKVDTTLLGLFQLIHVFLMGVKDNEANKRETLKCFEDSNLIEEILFKCLFSLHEFAIQQEGQIVNKCATTLTRKASFKVLQEYVTMFQPHEMVAFIQKYINPLVKDVERPKKWRHSPSSKGRVHQHVGIVNLGCICYMISMLQQFFMVPQFRYQLLKAEDNLPQNLQTYKDEQIDDNLLHQLQNLFGYLELSERHAFNPREFCFAFKEFDGTPTKIGEQKDSQEFLNIFCERIESMLKDTNQKYLMRDIFSGNQCSQLICQACGKVKNRMELFYNLSVQVKDCSGIYDSLSRQINGQTIEDYHCEGCNKKVNVTKRSLLANMPNVLIVHLQRIIFCFDTLMNDKINTKFEFPNVLDLRQFSFKELMKDQAIEEEEIQNLMNIDDDDYIYRLVGVNIHVGTADHGHYYSIINTKRGDQEPHSNEEIWKKVELDQWKVFDDSTIRPFAFNLDMKKEAFGGEHGGSAMTSDAMDDKELTSFLASGSQSYGKSAYMLIYERKSKKDLQVEEEHVPYKSVQKYVPQNIQERVQADNKNFITDSQLYNEDFMGFIKQIFKVIGGDLVMSQHKYGQDYLQNFHHLKVEALNLSNRIIFDMLCYYEKNVHLSSIAGDVQSVLTFCDSPHTINRNEQSIVAEYAQKVFVEDSCHHFLDIMFNCTDQSSRNYSGLVATKVFSRLFELYASFEQEKRVELNQIKEIQKIIEIFIERCFSSLKEKECLRNWTRLECYFQMLQKISTCTLTAAQLVMDRSDIIADLIDFMLGNKSPRAQLEKEVRTAMGGSFPPPFQPLYSLVATFIRMTHTTHMDLENRLGSHKEFEGKLEHESYKTYFLSDEAFHMLYKTEFLEKVIFDTKYTEVGEFSKALAHLCYRDLKFSRKCIKKVLKAISYSNNDDVLRLLSFVSELALIKDEYQQIRLEYLFGFPFLMHVNPGEDQLLQYGAKIMEKKNYEEVYQFSSGLDSKNHDDALLSLLWKYKGKMDSFTLTCLQKIGDLLVADEVVAAYFRQLPSINYNQSRYTDWVLPYLDNQLEEAKKYKATGTEEKLEQIIKVQTLFRLYQKDTVQTEEHIIIAADQEKEFKSFDLDDCIQIKVVEIQCKWAKSNPTGETNLGLDSDCVEIPKRLYRFDLTSNHAQALKFSLHIKVQEGLNVPKGGIKDYIAPGNLVHLITVHGREVENIDLDFKYKVYNGNDFQMGQYASQSDRPQKQQQQQATTGKRNLNQEIKDQRRNAIVTTPATEISTQTGGDDFSQKACPVCTLLNEFDAVCCEVCGNLFS